MQALVWTAKGHELAALSMQPALCAANSNDFPGVQAGKGLFNAPQLLGGQAARAGVSCASCHTNGRRNPHFFLDGVSSVPGTADVSSSFFSRARANALFDPKPVPDLTLPGKVSRDPASPDLEHFLRGLIVEEFAGHEPSKQALSALAAFVRSLRACPDRATEPHTIASELAVIDAAASGAAWMASRHDDETASVLISSARHQLGLIDERFQGPALHQERQRLLQASRQLEAIDRAPTPDAAAIEAWLMRFKMALAPRLRRAESRSLYAPSRLSKWLGRAKG